MVNLSISTDITIGSSCEGSTPLKSSSMKVMGGVLGQKEMVFTYCTVLRCFFLAVLELPPLAKPLTMVLMTSRPPLSSPPWSAIRLTIILSCSLRGVITPSCFLSHWRPFQTMVSMHKLVEVPDRDKLFNLILQALLGGMSTIPVISTPTSSVGVIRACCPSWWLD